MLFLPVKSAARFIIPSVFFLCSGLKEETAHAAHVAFRILSQTQGKKEERRLHDLMLHV